MKIDLFLALNICILIKCVVIIFFLCKEMNFFDRAQFLTKLFIAVGRSQSKNKIQPTCLLRIEITITGASSGGQSPAGAESCVLPLISSILIFMV